MKYVIVPLADGPFVGLDPMARLAFGLLWDRYKLSDRSVTYAGADDCIWYDHEYDDIYFVYDVVELAAAMGCSERTARRCLDDLKRNAIITWRRTKFGGANRYFIFQYIKDALRGAL